MNAVEEAVLTVDASPERVRGLLLDPLALPGWNPAFHSIDGPPEAAVGHEYRITVRPGLPGHFGYQDIRPDLIVTAWQVPGFSEEGNWLLRRHGAQTIVRHDFTHTGPLAALLSRAYRGVAGLRLERLSRTVAAKSAPVG